MTHRDGFPRFSARSAWRGDAGHRKPWATPPESLGTPPFRSRGRTAGGRRKASTMSRIVRGFPPTRRIACPISMGHYQRSLVSGRRTPMYHVSIAHPRNMWTEVGAGNPRWNRTRALDLGFRRIVRSLANQILGGYYLSAIVGTRAPCRGPVVTAPKGGSDKCSLHV